MAGTGADIGGFKGLEADKELSSHQDVAHVGEDSGGTKIEGKGYGNVSDDLGGASGDIGDDAELRESQETVIKLAEGGELFDKSVIAVEQDAIVSPADSGENEQSGTVLEVDEGELRKVEAAFEEGKSMGKPGLKLVDKSLESQITITGPIHCGPPQIDDDNTSKCVKDIDSDGEGEFQSGNEVDALAYKGIICTGVGNDCEVSKEKDLDMCIDGNQSVKEHDSTPSKVTAVASVNKEPFECGENQTAGTVDGASVKHKSSTSAMVQVSGAVNLVNIDSDRRTMSAELIGHIPPNVCGSFLASIDAGPAGLVLGDEAERVDLGTGPTNETDTRSVSDQTRFLQNSESEVACGHASCSPDDVRSGIKIEFGTRDSAVLLSKSCGGDVLFESQVSDGSTEYAWKQAISTTNSIESEIEAHMNFQLEDQYSSDMQEKHSTVTKPEVQSEFVVKGGTALPECSFSDSIERQDLVVVARVKPFQFLVKIPKFDDDKLQKRIKDAQMLVEAKTIRRDDLRRKIEMKRASLKLLNDNFEDIKSDGGAAKKLVKLKRQEIDSIQAGITRVKNSMSVVDITDRIEHMEYMIQHERNALTEEVQFIQEINQMKKLREQISSNVCSPEEVTYALSQLGQMEMQLKTLKKELDDLKAKVSEAEAACILLGNEYNGESKKLRELQGHFTAANHVRQDAYKDFLDLKKQYDEKSKHYWMYKDDAKAAGDYALNRDREALYRLCANQVESFMNVWNMNDEFRKDYVRCNMKSTLRRLKTSDGRRLGPDEAPEIPSYVDEIEGMQLSRQTTAAYPSAATILKQENKVQPAESEQVGHDLVVPEPQSKILEMRTSGETVRATAVRIDSVEVEAGVTDEEEIKKTEEELAVLKEQIRQEERAKAQEALERKRRNAEKAQIRAALRAQREAEQKEKEREKRLRKKEKKNDEGEAAVELQPDSAKDVSQGTKPKQAAHVNNYSKYKAALPPSLRNRGKRRLKQVLWGILAALAVFFIFLVGNAGPYPNFKPPRRTDRHFPHQWQPI